MRISARCNYACKALLELTLHWPNKTPLQIHVISEKQHIPMRYLVQILIQLKRSGLVKSLRGKKGGYILAKPPSEISLGGVMRQTGGPLLPLADPASNDESVFGTIWKELESVMAKVLDKITFEDILKKSKGAGEIITYHI